MKKKVLLLVLIIALSGLIFMYKSFILKNMGRMLLVHDEIKRNADLILVLRGGSFERVLEAYELYLSGFGGKICILESLSDLRYSMLETKGVRLPNSQYQLKSVLTQLGVPNSDIILDHQHPGGGTYGEAVRLKNLIFKMREVKRVIVVTSWFHTRRTKMIYGDVFHNTGIKILVHPALRYATSSSNNWWLYRYEAKAVIEEIFKVPVYYFINQLRFSDDLQQETVTAGGARRPELAVLRM